MALSAAFVVFVAVTGAATYFRLPLAHWLGAQASLWNQANVDALLVSLWATIIFSAVVGIVSFLISFRQPQEESLENRIWYLFSSPNATPGARAYLGDLLPKIAAFGAEGHIRITLGDYSAELNAYQVEVRNYFVLKNMLADLPFVDEAVEMSISADPVAANPRGALFELTASGEPKIDRMIKIVPPEVTLTRVFPMRIGENGTSSYSYHYWLWLEAGVEFTLQFNRYSEQIRLELRNGLSEWKVPVYLVGADGRMLFDDLVEPSGRFAQLARGVSVCPKQRIVMRFGSPRRCEGWRFEWHANHYEKATV